MLENIQINDLIITTTLTSVLQCVFISSLKALLFFFFSDHHHHLFFQTIIPSSAKKYVC